MRISNLLKIRWNKIRDDRLYYTMDKNQKFGSVKLHNKAKGILELYKTNDIKSADDFVFPYLRGITEAGEKFIHKKVRNANRLLNKHLKKIAGLAGIDKPLSMHVARHSFGNIAGNKIYPIELKNLYRHSDLKTTLNYQANWITKEIDDAVFKVLDF